MGIFQLQAIIRDKNQLTIPKELVERHKLVPGQKLVITDGEQPGEFVVRVIPKTYAGALAGVFGTTDENVEYVRHEREDWS